MPGGLSTTADEGRRAGEAPEREGSARDEPPREGQDRLQVVVREAELQAHEVVAPVAVQDVVDAAEQPQLAEELVAEGDAPAGRELFAEAEEVLPELEAVVEQVEVQADAAGRLLDAEPAGQRADALGELEREAEGVGGGGPD